jgi:uncharacterized protein (UPF0548 family)
VRLVLGHGPPTTDALARWAPLPRTDAPRSGLRHDRHRIDVAIAEGVGADSAFEAARDRLLEYRIFPEAILRPLVGTPDGRVRDDTVVVFRASLPRSPVSIEGGIRVIATWDRSDGDGRRAGFEIATLAGHPERGHERFEVRLARQARRLSFTIEAWSRPASFVVRLAGPIGRWIQVRASRAALRLFVDALPDPPRAVGPLGGQNGR